MGVSSKKVFTSLFTQYPPYPATDKVDEGGLLVLFIGLGFIIIAPYLKFFLPTPLCMSSWFLNLFGTLLFLSRKKGLSPLIDSLCSLNDLN